jgi:hypothetical protein
VWSNDDDDVELSVMTKGLRMMKRRNIDESAERRKMTSNHRWKKLNWRPESTSVMMTLYSAGMFILRSNTELQEERLFEMVIDYNKFSASPAEIHAHQLSQN